MRIRLQRPTSGQFGAVTASVALFVSLGGVSEAAKLINGKSLKNGSVSGKKIANNAITGAKIKGSAITGSDIKNGAVGAADLAASARSIGPAAVGNGQLADNSVTSAKIADLNVTNADLAPGAVGNGKLADRSVTGNKVGEATLTGFNLAGGAVDTGELADDAVTDTELAPGAVTGRAADASGVAVLDFNLGAQDCQSLAVAPSSVADDDLTDDVITATPIDDLVDGITYYAALSNQTTFSIVACNITPDAINLTPVAFRYVATDVAP